MPKATHSRNPFPSERPSPLRWGILATGGIAHKFVADLTASRSGTATACGSRTIEKARSFAQTHAIPRAYGSYGELARDPEVDVIYVASPHNFHKQDALACLRAGKAVLCEKPLTLNASETEELFSTAQESGVFLMEALWTYFLPALRVAQGWLAEERIGELKLIQADFGFASPYHPQSRWFNPDLAGGALLDVGVYVVSLAQWAAGLKVPKIKASARMAPTGVDESTSILLDWHSGVRAHLSCSIGHPLPNTAILYGERGTITLPDFWMARRAVLETNEGRTVFDDPRPTHGYEFEAQAVTAALHAGQTEHPFINRAFSLRLAQTMDTVRKQIGLVYPSER